jgi:hypothetical protein
MVQRRFARPREGMRRNVLAGKKPGTADAMPGLRSQALLFSTTAHAISRARVSLTPMIAVAGL